VGFGLERLCDKKITKSRSELFGDITCNTNFPVTKHSFVAQGKPATTTHKCLWRRQLRPKSRARHKKITPPTWGEGQIKTGTYHCLPTPGVVTFHSRKTSQSLSEKTSHSLPIPGGVGSLHFFGHFPYKRLKKGSKIFPGAWFLLTPPRGRGTLRAKQLYGREGVIPFTSHPNPNPSHGVRLILSPRVSGLSPGFWDPGIPVEDKQKSCFPKYLN
jgi:hypothetical protein